VLNRIKEHLGKHDGIDQVNVNAATGSVTVNYNPQQRNVTEIRQVFEDMDVIFGNLSDAPSVDASLLTSGKGEAPLTFVGAVEDLNKHLSQMMGIKIDLKIALPLAFVGVGLWTVIRNGFKFEQVPGWVFLWLAFDSFVKLHPSHPPAPISQPNG
jgi:hypothetical protein